MNGIAGLDAELAVLPAGTGQDFGRTHGIPTGFDDAVRVALDGTARTIDLGRVSYRDDAGGEAVRCFANVGSAGMSGAVARAGELDVEAARRPRDVLLRARSASSSPGRTPR